ncbi:hypothetical protein BSL78_06210 [Apostichopus japonicus]|uniref:Transposase domain-containing protein n=1 Tax=Stichopus japonicus TaxID=307972 RepID=A0A2G8L9G4_STIJA|nr:hypothetical protein BSL78_06210 [Apostichopus japonicus]
MGLLAFATQTYMTSKEDQRGWICSLRYLEEIGVEIPKRTRNRWKAAADGIPNLHEDPEANAQSDAEEGVPFVREIDIPENHCGPDDADDQGPVTWEREYPVNDSEEEDIFEDTVEELDDEHVLLEENGGVPPEECLPLYDGALITEPLSSLAILAFALRHSLTKVAVRDLLQLINIHLPVSCLPETFYLFSKNFDERTEEVEFHTYCSVWPIQCLVKALPPNIRKKYILISGLWFGTSKPQFSTFLKPFVDEFHNLAEDGVRFTDATTGVEHNTKVFATLCACDSVARCQLQGITQFNEHFGCSWCLHEGEVVPKGRGHVMTYPYDFPPPEQRSQRGMEDQAIRLGSGMPQDEGVKEISPLLVLPRFDIVRGFPVDYMHAVCEGVGQHLLNLWFDRTHHNEEWFIGDSLSTVDERIENISPPNDDTRLPRSPSQRAHWKASEFRSWILFYSLPVLKGVLPSAYLAHMLLLVHAIWMLLQDSVKEHEISLCEIILVKFVIQMKELYGAHNMSYNVHLLLHLADTVRNCGPLWSNSCFPFEGYNRKIKSLFHGTRYIQLRLLKTLHYCRFCVIGLNDSLPIPHQQF